MESEQTRDRYVTRNLFGSSRGLIQNHCSDCSQKANFHQLENRFFFGEIVSKSFTKGFPDATDRNLNLWGGTANLHSSHVTVYRNMGDFDSS